jgi:hypothetical protein
MEGEKLRHQRRNVFEIVFPYFLLEGAILQGGRGILNREAAQ